MNLVTPPQPCSGRRSHRIEFQFSDNSRLQVFVCERHAKSAGAVEQALLAGGEFPTGACLVATSTQELPATPAAPARLATATSN